MRTITEGEFVTVTFTDEKGFTCRLEGHVQVISDEKLICDPIKNEKIMRFSINRSEETLMILTQDDNTDALSYSYDEFDSGLMSNSHNQEQDNNTNINIFESDDDPNFWQSKDFNEKYLDKETHNIDIHSANYRISNEDTSDKL